MSYTYRWCEQGSTRGLSEAIERLYQELPGWWFSVGNCHVSADATIAPDRTGPDADLLRFREFDEGIHGDLLHPATLADALNRAIDDAKALKVRYIASAGERT